MNEHVTIDPYDQHAPVYLVVEKDFLIASDLAATLESSVGARVIHTSHLDDVEQILNNLERLDAAFLDVSIACFMRRGLDSIMRKNGASVIFTVGEDEQERAAQNGWNMLVRPFSEDMIIAALLAAKQRV